jgi:hypothetical protein
MYVCMYVCMYVYLYMYTYIVCMHINGEYIQILFICLFEFLLWKRFELVVAMISFPGSSRKTNHSNNSNHSLSFEESLLLLYVYTHVNTTNILHIEKYFCTSHAYIMCFV